ncbi:MAG: DUF5916 domain-containing protein [Vicinamibacterales bacterium]
MRLTDVAASHHRLVCCPSRAGARAGSLLLSAVLWVGASVSAPAQPRDPAGVGRSPATNPPGPSAPEVLARDASGQRATVRAIRLTQPLRIDGRLDESLYQEKAVEGFIQTLPNEGQPSTERTEAWIAYDDRNLYVACRCWDSAPPERWVANEMRRDTNQLRQNDMFGLMVDTFHDKRNGFNFYTNPLGAMADQVFTDEGNPNADWNPVWYVRTGRFEGGWTVEMSIPFRSLRYRSGDNQVWGLQVRRAIRRKNEWAHLTLVPAATGGASSIFRVSAAGDLVGLNLPPASRNIELKPYGISRLTTDRLRSPALNNEVAMAAGIDGKYGITANLTADVTIKTDFAQVEVDEQQVNLTRFALQFPEKREFFLEGRGIFEFGRSGGVGVGTANTTGGTGVNAGPAASAPLLFYTRRIGLNSGREVPIDVGGRVTGKVGKYNVGVINIETGEEAASATPATNYTVARVKRDILRRSAIGLMLMNRSVSSIGPGGNQAFGADGTFSFFQNLNFGGYYARTWNDGVQRETDSYQGRFDYLGDRYGARFDYLKVGDNFNPEIGLVRRDNFRRSWGMLRFSPRPKRHKYVRKYTWEAALEYLVNGQSQLETRTGTGRFNVEFQNSDQFTIEAADNYELLVRPFTVVTGVTIPTGSYRFRNVNAGYGFGQQRRISGTVNVARGQFYDGAITTLTVSGARVAVTRQFSVEPSLTLNDVHLSVGDFTTKLARARADYAFSPRRFVSALVQYSTSDRSFSSNLRFRWEYIPGSELFVVYTDDRDPTLPTGVPALKNRAFVIKINRMLRF